MKKILFIALASYSPLQHSERMVIIVITPKITVAGKTITTAGLATSTAGYVMMANSKATRRKGTTEERMNFKGENHSRNSKGHR